MAHNERNDWLDDLLRIEEPHVEENGFADKVLEQLPPAPTSLRIRAIILLVSLSLGGVTGLFVLPGGETIARALTRVSHWATWASPRAHLDAIFFSLLLVTGLIGGAIGLALSER
jgi:hypothetical protein